MPTSTRRWPATSRRPRTSTTSATSGWRMSRRWRRRAPTEPGAAAGPRCDPGMAGVGSAAFEGPLKPVLNLLAGLVGVEVVAPGGDLAVGIDVDHRGAGHFDGDAGLALAGVESRRARP